MGWVVEEGTEVAGVDVVKLPERFLKAEAEVFCPVCDKVRATCRQCERCREHCDCSETCPRCGGLMGTMAWKEALVLGKEECRCLECIICHTMTIDDHMDFSYGLTEEQTQENTGCSSTGVCETCVNKKRIPPSAKERGFIS